MKTIKEERLRDEYGLTWKEISNQKGNYSLPNKEINVRGFLEDKGYGISVSISDDMKLFKPYFIFNDKNEKQTRQLSEKDCEWVSLKKAEEIALMQALKDFEEQLYLNRFKEVK